MLDKYSLLLSINSFWKYIYSCHNTPIRLGTLWIILCFYFLDLIFRLLVLYNFILIHIFSVRMLFETFETCFFVSLLLIVVVAPGTCRSTSGSSTVLDPFSPQVNPTQS